MPNMTQRVKRADNNKWDSRAIAYKSDKNLEDVLDSLLADSKILWSGASYMFGEQQAKLSEKISDQKNGIIICWSAYSNNQAQNWNFNIHVIPKEQVKQFSGYGVSFLLTDNSFGSVAAKYLYIHDDHLTGHDYNNKSGTGSSGIKYTNNAYVLRYVLGF